VTGPVLLLMLALLLAACGSADDASTTAATSTQATTASTSGSSTSTSSTSGSSTPATPSTTASKKKKKNVVAWILSLGPGAPDGPPEFTAYRELQELHCATVFARVGELDEPARTLYIGAAHACLAATKGESDRWPRAAAALRQVAAKTGELNCMDVAALALLDRLVTLHEKHPGGTFQLAAKGKSKAPPCPTIDAITPDRAVEETVVRMTGRHLGDVVADDVTVIDSLGNSLDVGEFEHVDGSLEFRMPVAPSIAASATVCIVVRAEPDWVADGAEFTYESETTGPPTPISCPPPRQD
jgi:hypothetical protein